MRLNGISRDPQRLGIAALHGVHPRQAIADLATQQFETERCGHLQRTEQERLSGIRIVPHE